MLFVSWGGKARTYEKRQVIRELSGEGCGAVLEGAGWARALWVAGMILLANDMFT